MLLPTPHRYPVFLGVISSMASISMSKNPPHPSQPSRVGGMEGPVQPQAGHPVALAGLLFVKAQQGQAVGQDFVGDSVFEADQHKIETTRSDCS